MAVINWSQFSTHLQQPMTLQTSAGTALVLTGLSNNAITLKMRRASPGSIYIPLSGVATIQNAGLGQISYKFASSDVAIPGQYRLVVSVVFAANDIWNSFEQDFNISQSQ